MAQTFFVWLGSNRARKHGVAETGVLLDQATRARLPVPTGGILLTSFYEGLVADGLLVEANGRIICPNPALLHESLYQTVRFPKLDKPVAVRPLFTVASSHFAPPCNVHFTDPTELSQSLCEVYSAAVYQPESGRRDVLVMEMVKIVGTGTAVSSASQSTDKITYNEQSLTLPQLGIFQSASADLPAFAQRVQMLLRGIRRTFGKGKWRVNWADDGQVCWILELAGPELGDGR